MAKNQFVLLEQPRYFSNDAYYIVILKEGTLYFCRVKHRDIWKKTRVSQDLSPISSEEVLLRDNRSFKLDVSQISAVALSGERSPWDVLNSGTVEITVAGKTKKYLIGYLTTFVYLKEFLQSAGCPNLTVQEASVPVEETLPPLRRGEAKRITRRLAPVSKLGSAFMILLFAWIVYPIGLKAGIVILFLLPFLSLLILQHYRVYFKKVNRGGRANSAWSYLITFVLLPPLALCIVFMRDFAFIYPKIFPVLVSLVAVATPVVCLMKNPKLRSKPMAITLALFAAAIFFSGVLTTNYLFDASLVADYPVTVQDMTVHHAYRSGSTYYLTVSPISENAGSLEITVPGSVYHNKRIGEPVTLSLQKGLWGIKWYEIT